ncbi:excisionase family DNA-binding protein [Mucisphaera sp.]|uniref:MerR family transcriptional regulator n=1 Tax=Mucisphaera sp. TaxID=2913024 RepID=UPI003D11364E
MPKTYLTTREMARAIDVSPSTMKRWVDLGTIRAPRTAGGHRRIPLDEAVRFIRTSGMPVRDPAAMGLPELAAGLRDRFAAFEHFPAEDAETQPPTTHPLAEALAQGDVVRFRGVLLDLYLRGTSVATICDGPLANLLNPQRPTNNTTKPSEHVAHGHRDADLCVQGLSHIRQLQPSAPAGAPRAVGGAAPDDRSEVGTVMAATLLGDLGWDVLNLGAATPAEVLASAVALEQVDLVWMIVSRTCTTDELNSWINTLATAIQGRSTTAAILGHDLPHIDRPLPENLHLFDTWAAFETTIKDRTAS